jgi:hypothetical protein
VYSTLYKGENFCLTIWTIWVSKDAEFFVEFKNINVPKNMLNWDLHKKVPI